MLQTAKHKAIVGIRSEYNYILYEIEINTATTERKLLEVETVIAAIKLKIGYDERELDDELRKEFDELCNNAIIKFKEGSFHHFKHILEKHYRMEITKPTFFTGKTY